jgi:3',5'-cyclic AMP phosphodiesterase CpdA
MKFIHVSDLHYHRNQAKNREANSLLKFVADRYPTHNLIVTGDITDDGHEKQYENAGKALERFKGRVFVVPGNHDFGAVGSFYSRERAERFDQFLSSPLDQGGTFFGPNPPVVNVVEGSGQEVMLIALDTNLETDHPWDFACGRVGEPQLAALDTVLCTETARTAFKILFFHHHPFMHNNPFMELQDAAQLWRTIFARVHVVAFGHKHVYGTWQQRNGVPWIIASDDSPGKKYAHEITVAKSGVTVRDVPISAQPKKKKRKAA